MKTIILFLFAAGAAFGQCGTAAQYVPGLGCKPKMNPTFGTTVIDPVNGIKAPIIACVGTPGNTTGPYGSLCEVRASGALWSCTNASGCTASGDWAAAGGGGGVSGSGLTNLSLIVGQGSNAIAAAAGLTTDGAGSVIVTGSITAGSGGSTGGAIDLTQGSDPGSAPVNTIREYAPTSVTAYRIVKPGALTTGLRFVTASGVNGTEVFAPPAGTGDHVVMSPALGGVGNCAQWASTGLTDSGNPCPIGGGGSAAGATLFSTTGSTAVTAASATTLIGTVTGSTSIPANTFIAGSLMQMYASGYYTSTGSRTLTLDLKIGGSVRITTGAITMPNATTGTWELTCGVTTRTAGTSGTQIANCTFKASGATLTGGAIAPMQTSSNWTVNTTGTLAVDLQATWDATTGAPTITSTNIAAWIPGAPVTTVNGGTGAVVTASNGAFASRPPCASTNNGTTYYASDSIVTSVCDGANWKEYINGFQRTAPPAASSLTWTNQGSAAATDANGGILVTLPADGSDQWHLLCKSVTAPYTWTVGYLSNFNGGAITTLEGLAFFDGTKVMFFGYGVFSNGTVGTYLARLQYSSFNTFSSTGFNVAFGGAEAFQFLSLADDNTNLKGYLSPNPFDVTRASSFSVGRTAFMASGPTKACLAMSNQSGVPSSMWVGHWAGI